MWAPTGSSRRSGRGALASAAALDGAAGRLETGECERRERGGGGGPEPPGGPRQLAAEGAEGGAEVPVRIVLGRP